jgi:hypothetical protein
VQLEELRKDVPRQKAIKEAYPTKSVIKSYAELGEYPLHEGQNPVINTLDIH